MPGAIIGAVGGIIGGGLQAHAATKAAEIQAQAGSEIAAQARADAGTAGQQVQDAAQQAASGVTDAANTAATNVENSAESGATSIEQGVGTANDLLKAVYGDQTTALQPYLQTGTAATAGLNKEISGLSQPFQFSEDDPSYQWRLQQGQQALERSAAARGAALSGGTAKALLQYAQGAASQEYQAAFDRYQTDRQNRANLLLTAAGLGQNATNQYIGAGSTYAGRASENIMGGKQSAANLRYTGTRDAGNFTYGGARDAGNFTYGGARDAAGYLMDANRTAAEAIAGAANARAAGTVGAANAWGNAIGNAANTIGAYYDTRPPRGVTAAPVGTGAGAASAATWGAITSSPTGTPILLPPPNIEQGNI